MRWPASGTSRRWPFCQRSRTPSQNSKLVALDQQRSGEAGGQLGDRSGVATRGAMSDFEQCLEEADASLHRVAQLDARRYAIRAAHAGVHVLCEKPLAVTSGECDRIIAACRQADVLVMTAYRLHFERVTLWALDQVRRGHIGDLRYLTSAFSMRARPGGIRTHRNRRRHALRPRDLLHQRGTDVPCKRTLRASLLRRLTASRLACRARCDVERRPSFASKATGCARFVTSFDERPTSSSLRRRHGGRSLRCAGRRYRACRRRGLP